MAITSIETVRDVSAETSGRQRTYNVTYRVTTDSDDDGPIDILTDPLCPRLYETRYQYQSDDDNQVPAYATDVSVRGRDYGGTGKRNWLLDVTYFYDQSEWEFTRSTVVTPHFEQRKIVKPRYEFRGVHHKDAAGLQWVLAQGQSIVTIGDDVAAVNSALSPYNPPPEVYESVVVYKISFLKSKSNWSVYKDLIGTTNFNHFKVTSYHTNPASYIGASLEIDHTYSFRPGDLLFRNAYERPTWIAGRYQYETELEFEFSSKDEGHDLVILDQGYMESAVAGDDDGRGGQIETIVQEDGTLLMRSPKSTTGETITEKVLLNGKGKALGLGDINPLDQPDNWRYIRYRVYPYEDWSALTQIIPDV